jgi:hypothetical protein
MVYIIYVIRHTNKDIEWCYVGSTKNFRLRKYGHKSGCNNPNDYSHYNHLVYKYMRENGGWDEFEMVPIEEYECENFTQARIREEYWRQYYKAQGNSKKAYTSEEERIEYLRQQNKLKNGLYYIENKDKIIKYRQENKDKIKQQKQKYRQENKEKIKEYKKTQFICECGCVCNISSKWMHIKTDKHNNILNKKIEGQRFKIT